MALVVNFINAEEQASLQKVVELSNELNTPIWVVGGVVRDILLGANKRLADIDLVVEGDATRFVSELGERLSLHTKIFTPFFTAKVLGMPSIDELDFASTRKEHYLSGGALPSVTLGTLAEDGVRRDFSVNALYVKLAEFLDSTPENLSSRVLDPGSGLDDLKARLIRILHDCSFIDDPTRLFRALRYRVRIEGELESSTRVQFQNALASECIDTISSQRVLNEINKACCESLWTKVLQDFVTFGLMAAAKLVDPDKQIYLAKMLNAPCELTELQDRSEYFNTLLFWITPETSRETRFRKYGFGKKFFKRMSELAAEHSEPDKVKIVIDRNFGNVRNLI